MSSISLNGDTSGSILIQAPAVAGSGTLTLPTGTATLGIAGPAFSAYRGVSTQSIPQTTWTTVIFDTKDFDTATCYSTSNGRFTPNVAGYYALSFNLEFTASITGFVHTMFYKNGSYYTRGGAINCSGQGAILTGSNVMYLNGSTDYTTIGVYISISGQSLDNSNYSCRFSGSLVRAA